MQATPLLPEPARERLRRACASLDLAERTGSPFAMSQALAEVARSYQDLDAHASAEAHLEQAVRWGRLCGSVDHLADLLCECAEAAVRVAKARESQLLAGDDDSDEAAQPGRGADRAVGHASRERARDRAFEVSQLAGRISDPSCEARLLLRVGEVLECCGDHADALQMQLRALNRMGGVAPRDASQLSGFGRLADV